MFSALRVGRVSVVIDNAYKLHVMTVKTDKQTIYFTSESPTKHDEIFCVDSALHSHLHA